MARQIPNELQAMMRHSTVRAAFLSETASPNPTDCQNCGGVGCLYVFLATAGPLQTAPGGGQVGHSDERGRWWVGKTFSAICPECKGLGKREKIIEYNAPIPDGVGELARKLEAK